MSDTEKDKYPNRVAIAISSQQMDDRCKMESAKAKALKMGVSPRILRLFDDFS